MRTRFIAVAVLAAVLVPAIALAAGDNTTTLGASLNGKVEVPKGDTDGTGTAKITVDGRKVCWTITTAKVAKPNAAHIHKGRPGKAGPVVVPLGAAYKAKGCTTTTRATAMALTAKPGSFYVNVHNAAYAAGAVRGQLGK
jgi:CHRD domain